VTGGADPALVKAVVANESGFDPVATSPAGAQGLMQLMPGTAAGLGVRDAYDPAQNIAGGTRYLMQLLQRFNGDVPTALAAYNAGPQAIARGEMPVETQHYVRSVLDAYARYRSAKP
jgi:soluble lytic murein transglycosylase-like protein